MTDDNQHESVAFAEKLIESGTAAGKLAGELETKFIGYLLAGNGAALVSIYGPLASSSNVELVNAFPIIALIFGAGLLLGSLALFCTLIINIYRGIIFTNIGHEIMTNPEKGDAELFVQLFSKQFIAFGWIVSGLAAFSGIAFVIGLLRVLSTLW